MSACNDWWKKQDDEYENIIFHDEEKGGEKESLKGRLESSDIQ